MAFPGSLVNGHRRATLLPGLLGPSRVAFGRVSVVPANICLGTLPQMALAPAAGIGLSGRYVEVPSATVIC